MLFPKLILFPPLFKLPSLPYLSLPTFQILSYLFLPLFIFHFSCPFFLFFLHFPHCPTLLPVLLPFLSYISSCPRFLPVQLPFLSYFPSCPTSLPVLLPFPPYLPSYISTLLSATYSPLYPSLQSIKILHCPSALF